MRAEAIISCRECRPRRRGRGGAAGRGARRSCLRHRSRRRAARVADGRSR